MEAPSPISNALKKTISDALTGFSANDLTVTMAAHSGLLQLNAYEPVEAIAIMESQGLLFKSLPLFRKQCIDGITANETVLKHYIERSIGIVTALNPVLGYEKTTELAKESLKTGKGILELIREQHLLTEDQITKLLDPATMTGQK
jgi:aspartate ammonia-lyase